MRSPGVCARAPRMRPRHPVSRGRRAPSLEVAGPPLRLVHRRLRSRSMPRPVGINHVAVEVDDIDGALAFFERIFGELELRGRSRSMAFVDLGDQFIALSAGRSQPPDGARHIGLVVDGREETLERAAAAGARMLADNDFLDPWGNHWQVVEYRDVQFTK